MRKELMQMKTEGKSEYITPAMTSLSLSADCAFLNVSIIDINKVTVEDTQDGFEGSDEEESTFNF